MENAQISPLLWSIIVVWGIVTIVWIALLIYRGRITGQEDDQIFLDPGEEHMAREQREIISRAMRLDKPVLGLGILSGLLLVAGVVVWLWQALRSF
jgi:Tfp pilus assembly protein PilN